MFGSLGLPELLLIFVVALIVFGPRKLPEIGRTLGKALGEFKKATDDLKNTIEREVRARRAEADPPAPSTMRSVHRRAVSRSEPVRASMAERTPAPSPEPLRPPLRTAPRPMTDDRHDR